MARARNIKPGFFSNDQLLELPFSTRLLFIGLWVIADRAGRLLDRPKKIKIDVFPGDDVDCDAALNELAAAGFIRRYESCGIKAICITTWDKHQNPHCKECASTIPAPDERRIEHSASTVQARCEESSLPEPAHFLPERAGLIPDTGYPIPDSGLPLADSGFPSLPPPALPPSQERPDSQMATANAKPAGKEKPTSDETALQAACRETFRAYQAAYTERHGTPHTDNAKVRSQIKQFVQRVPYAEAPLIAAWFPSHTATKYVQNLHTVGFLLSDVDKLRTEWATGQTMSATRAMQIDRTSANLASHNGALALLQAKGLA